MASPFSLFRKHQRVSLAAITFLAMVAFVFSGMFTRAGSGPTGPGKQQAAATWKFGEISKSEVDRHMQWAAALNQYLENAYKMAAAKGAVQLQGVPRFEDKSRDYTLELIVLAKKAETLGIVVSDKAINDYIDDVTDHKLTQADKERLFAQQMGPRSQNSSDELFDEFRFQLLAADMINLLRGDTADIGTPAGVWDYFNRVARQATIQAMPVDAKDFVSQVPDPPEEKLQQFFEKYKTTLPQLGNPEPGFKIPAKGEFQYFEAVRADFVKQEKPKITDAQIKEYYDAHKENFRRSMFNFDDKSSPLFQLDKVTPKADAGSKTEPKKTDEKSDKSKADDKSKTAPKAKGAEKEKSGTDVKGAGDKAGDNSSDKSKSDKAGDKTPDKSKDTKPADDKGPANKSSRRDRSRSGESVPVANSRLQGEQSELIAFAFADPDKTDKIDKSDAKSEPAKAAEPSKADAKDAKSDAKTQPANAAPAKTEPAKPESGKQSPAKEPATTPAKGDAVKTDSKSASETPGGKSPAAAKTNPGEFDRSMLYDSVDDPKIRDQIRETLATDAAATTINDILAKLRPKVSKYNTELAKWRAKGKVAADKPQPPDFKAIAKEFGVEFKETGLVSPLELTEKADFGKSLSEFRQGDQIVGRSVGYQAFGTGLKIYQPEESVTKDAEIDFLWWRTTDLQPAKVPDSLDAVRAEVVLAWKMIEARKLAQAKADEYVAEANRRHLSLKEAFGFKPGMPKVIEPRPFSWLTRRSVPENTEMDKSPPVLSRIQDIDLAGPSFMAKVFGLEVGSATVAFNEPRTVAYVIQLQDLQPRETAMRTEFLNRIVNPADPLVTQSRLAAREDAQNVLRQKVRAIEKEFDFEAVPQSNSDQSAEPINAGDTDD